MDELVAMAAEPEPEQEQEPDHDHVPQDPAPEPEPDGAVNNPVSPTAAEVLDHEADGEDSSGDSSERKAPSTEDDAVADGQLSSSFCPGLGGVKNVIRDGRCPLARVTSSRLLLP
uniref:Uncharacterized protein n=2 Tax=Oryza TaxID=4527 RepID=A0A0D3G7F2_9ORYZ